MLPEHSVQLHSEVPPNQTGIFKNVLIPPFYDSCLEARGGDTEIPADPAAGNSGETHITPVFSFLLSPE